MDLQQTGFKNHQKMSTNRPNFNQAAYDLIIRRENGFQVDHIGLCVQDTEKGVGWLEDQTGAKVHKIINPIDTPFDEKE